MSQMDLAAAAGTDPQSVSAVETGRRDAYSARVAALARALNVSADYLLGLTDDPAPRGRL
jgi:transcriptional regulator with XRE-family HTH domain